MVCINFFINTQSTTTLGIHIMNCPWVLALVWLDFINVVKLWVHLPSR